MGCAVCRLGKQQQWEGRRKHQQQQLLCRQESSADARRSKLCTYQAQIGGQIVVELTCCVHVHCRIVGHLAISRILREGETGQEKRTREARAGSCYNVQMQLMATIPFIVHKQQAPAPCPPLVPPLRWATVGLFPPSAVHFLCSLGKTAGNNETEVIIFVQLVKIHAADPYLATR